MIGNTVQLSEDVVIRHPDLVNLYGCTVGDGITHRYLRRDPEERVHWAELQGVRHSFICEGVTIDDEVFVGHGVMFTND